MIMGWENQFISNLPSPLSLPLLPLCICAKAHPNTPQPKWYTKISNMSKITAFSKWTSQVRITLSLFLHVLIMCIYLGVQCCFYTAYCAFIVICACCCVFHHCWDVGLERDVYIQAHYFHPLLMSNKTRYRHRFFRKMNRTLCPQKQSSNVCIAIYIADSSKIALHRWLSALITFFYHLRIAENNEPWVWGWTWEVCL